MDERLRNLVRTRIADEPERVWRASDLVKALALRGKAATRLPGLLHEMTRDGEIVELRHGGYGMGLAADLLTGRLDVMRSGNALVRDRSAGTQVWVRPEAQSTALPGDLVLVRLDSENADQDKPTREGRVARIIERSQRDIVGTLHSTGRFFYVVPLNPVYKQDFYVPPHAGAAVGDRVVIRFLAWPNRHVNPEGEIVEVLGPANNPSLDTEAILRQYDLPRAFPDAVTQEADHVVERMQRPGKREDCRDRMIITIDPETARDFDDALSLESLGGGRWELGVHIADVSHFVRPGSALDDEARERATSVYLPDLVIPMLPEALSNGVCSLRPNEDRLAFSAFLTLDEAGAVRKRRFARTRIRSRLRLSYAQAMALIAGNRPPAVPELPDSLPDGVVELLRHLHGLAQTVRARRFKGGALDLEVPECEVLMGADGRMTGLRPIVNDVSHQLVEECMVLANEAVAAELQGRGIRIIARLHEPPDPEKMAELSEELKTLGFRPGDLSNPRNLAAFLDGIAAHPLRHHAHVMVLRSMKRAVYSADDQGHFGLGKTHYAHFTSPIRRYPDLTLHRQLSAFLVGRKPKHAEVQHLKADALLSTEREQRADEASRAILEIKKYRYLQQQLDDGRPEVYQAVIAKITNFGCFIDITDLQLSGLVHVSAMSEHFVRYDGSSQALVADGKRYQVGHKLQVQVVRVDFNQRRADFALVAGKDAKTDAKAHTGKKTASARRKTSSRRAPRSGPRSAKVKRA